MTICAYQRECLLEGASVAALVKQVWQELPQRFPGVVLDEFVVMPNHVHFIVWITAANENVGAGLALPNKKGAASSAPTLGNVVRAFKSITAIAINRHLGRSGTPLWQRNYYEHIIRNEEELNRLREYIYNNPLRWHLDRENPNRIGEDVFERSVLR